MVEKNTQTNTDSTIDDKNLSEIDENQASDGQAIPIGRYLASTLYKLRIQHGLTLGEVSSRVGISSGMLSRIENGLSATSIETLELLANALGISLSKIFQGYDLPISAAQFVKKDTGMEVVRRGTRSGHTYQLLAYNQGPQKTFEPFLITLEDPGEEFSPFEHAGTEFIYMLEGSVEYRVGAETFILEPGDSLTFRGEVPHRPERHIKSPIRFLATIHYDMPKAEDD
ncbi:helix-turn-helix domain-containing protein [Methyloradius palustris]|uniref:XRE family transcriptional regulator n=1 Tax=Methyloradius palustris TaxID=2778876 RepID=A0A8D5K0T8_9PROT|nr:XRE family transcriptional regulator [Methyloradius palustris]BCM25078.1 XRE family transcriptional regulator [Methyloradius palustris]